MPPNPSWTPVIECPNCGGLHKLTRPYYEIVRDCIDRRIRAQNRKEALAKMSPEEKEAYFARMKEKEKELRDVRKIESQRHQDRRRRKLGF